MQGELFNKLHYLHHGRPSAARKASDGNRGLHREVLVLDSRGHDHAKEGDCSGDLDERLLDLQLGEDVICHADVKLANELWSV